MNDSEICLCNPQSLDLCDSMPRLTNYIRFPPISKFSFPHLACRLKTRYIKPRPTLLSYFVSIIFTFVLLIAPGGCNDIQNSYVHTTSSQRYGYCRR